MTICRGYAPIGAWAAARVSYPPRLLTRLKMGRSERKEQRDVRSPFAFGRRDSVFD